MWTYLEVPTHLVQDRPWTSMNTSSFPLFSLCPTRAAGIWMGQLVIYDVATYVHVQTRVQADLVSTTS